MNAQTDSFCLTGTLLVLAFTIAGCAHPFERMYSNNAVETNTGGICPDQNPIFLGQQQVQRADPASPSAPSTPLTPAPPPTTQWKIQPCEQLVLRTAIDQCLSSTMKTNTVDNIWDRATTGGEALVVVAGLAAGIAGIVVVNPPVSIAGFSTVVASTSTNLSKVAIGTPATPVVTSMQTAAQTYAMTNSGLLPPKDFEPSGSSEYTNAYYAGLWNAVGSACPPQLLAGGFVPAEVYPGEELKPLPPGPKVPQ